MEVARDAGLRKQTLSTVHGAAISQRYQYLFCRSIHMFPEFGIRAPKKTSSLSIHIGRTLIGPMCWIPVLYSCAVFMCCIHVLCSMSCICEIRPLQIDAL